MLDFLSVWEKLFSDYENVINFTMYGDGDCWASKKATGGGLKGRVIHRFIHRLWKSLWRSWGSLSAPPIP
jgi:hypothetical protein